MMISVKFDPASTRTYSYIVPDGVDVKIGDHVVVHTNRNELLALEVLELNATKLPGINYKPIVGIATIFKK